MADEPRAEQIAQGIVAALEGVSVVGGYWNDLDATRVGRRRMEVQRLVQAGNMPNAAVWIGEWRPDPKKQCVGHEWAVYRLFGCEMYYRSAEAADVDRDGARIEQDAIYAVRLAGQFGLDFVYQVDAVKGQADHQQFGDPNVGWKLIWFGVGYTDSAA